jgi:hypothetical protein
MNNTREIVRLTLSNMVQIYEDAGNLIRLIEDHVKGKGLQPIGSTTEVTWDRSTVLSSPAYWVHRWLGRAYIRNGDARGAVGFCIHLGEYSADHIEGAKLALEFPFMTVARVDVDRPASRCDRKTLLNGIWGAGWHRDFTSEPLIGSSLVKGRFSSTWQPVRTARAYFVDLLAMTDKASVAALVVDPIMQLADNDDRCTLPPSSAVWNLASKACDADR